MVKLKEQDNELFYVQLKEPNEVRRNILETLKHIVEVLQKFEKFKHTRHYKFEKINHLRVLVRQANKILSDLKAKLPQTNLRATIAREVPKYKKHHKKKKGKVVETKVTVPKKEMTEVEKLESELNAIESKLKGLT